MIYQHLTLGPRYQIAALHREGCSNKHIAQRVGCHPSTITRELRRNAAGGRYDGAGVHGYAKRRRQAASSRAHLPEAVQRELVAGLEEKHSPDQIRGRMA